MKEALIEFVRGFVSAGVAAAALFLTTNLEATRMEELLAGIALAFIAGVIKFVGEYLRQVSPDPAFRAVRPATKSKLDWLPF